MASIKCIIPVRGKKKKGCARLHIPLECLQKGMNGTVYKIHALCFFYGTVLMNEKNTPDNSVRMWSAQIQFNPIVYLSLTDNYIV